ncbi:MAG: hypothetical protein U0791_24285 [Gemmataceae bacterium]
MSDVLALDQFFASADRAAVPPDPMIGPDGAIIRGTALARLAETFRDSPDPRNPNQRLEPHAGDLQDVLAVCPPEDEFVKTLAADVQRTLDANDLRPGVKHPMKSGALRQLVETAIRAAA